MNERIQELWKEAEEGVLSEPKTGHIRTVVGDVNEKFAELIVKECADLFDDDPDSGTRYTGIACRSMIKNYFGVQE